MASGMETGAAGGAAARGVGTAARDRQAIAQNFDQFLLLLTTQLQNQSPLDPLDTNQFTQQLVQFATVEQQIKGNEMLSELIVATRASNVATASSFVGQRITAAGRTAELVDGEARWTLEAPRAAANAAIDVLDENGRVVASQVRPIQQGRQDFVWDGTLASGQQAPPGTYRLRITATDVSGQPVDVRTTFSGIVDALDLTGNEPILVIGKVRVHLLDITGVERR